MICNLDTGMELVSESEIAPHYHEEFVNLTHRPRFDIVNPSYHVLPPYPPTPSAATSSHSGTTIGLGGGGNPFRHRVFSRSSGRGCGIIGPLVKHGSR